MCITMVYFSALVSSGMRSQKIFGKGYHSNMDHRLVRALVKHRRNNFDQIQVFFFFPKNNFREVLCVPLTFSQTNPTVHCSFRGNHGRRFISSLISFTNGRLRNPGGREQTVTQTHQDVFTKKKVRDDNVKEETTM